MNAEETREYLKRQVQYAPGATPEQRERWYVIELVYQLHAKVNRLETKLPQSLALAALELFVTDQHRWSTRPCSTCRSLSKMLGTPFGCEEFREKK